MKITVIKHYKSTVTHNDIKTKSIWERHSSSMSGNHILYIKWVSGPAHLLVPTSYYLVNYSYAHVFNLYAANHSNLVT